MSVKIYARFNVRPAASVTADEQAQLQDLLFDSAIWAEAEDPEVFVEEDNNVFGISVELENELLSILETGAVLGQCQSAYEKSGIAVGTSWFSIHDEHGKVIDAGFDPTC